jgi:hypothetical protein
MESDFGWGADPKYMETLERDNKKLKAWLDAIVDGGNYDLADARNQYQNYRSGLSK